MASFPPRIEGRAPDAPALTFSRRGLAALWRLLALPLLAWLLVAGAARAQALEPLTVVTREGARHAFSVEVARTAADRAQGLMFRRSLAPDRGMLFDFERAQPLAMWMQNTYVSLDMLFIRADGTVARVARDTEPLSTREIPSGEPVLAVLEVVAGTAARLGLRPGDRVEHPLFQRR